MASPSFLDTLHSCDICQKFVFGPPRTSEDEELWWAGPPGSRVRQWVAEVERQGAVLPLGLIVFDATIADVKSAAAVGCCLCKWFVEQRLLYDDSLQGLNDDSIFAAEIYSEYLGRFGEVWMCRNAVSRGDVVRMVDFCNPVFQLSTSIDEMTDPDSQSWWMNTLPNSEFSSRQISRWFDTCRTSHKKCHTNQTSFRPKRLIKIEQRQGRKVLRLCEKSPVSDVVDYAALSYCWGKNQNVKTTASTIERHILGISMTDLPLTIQHAVIVAETLGLCYLWVDALCIIQDNDDDKAWEIAQIPRIYMGASVTICASRAGEVQEGFLQQREATAPELAFRLPFRDKNGILSTVVLHNFIFPPLEPLSTRAWALQEKWLSTKTLDFGTTETSWTCKEVDVSDRPMQIRERRQPSQHLQDPEPHELLERASQEWQALVRTYTSRNLTISADRLPAISGIAEQFHHRMHVDDSMDYAAGLWGSTMLYDLLWYIMWEGPTHRPEQYQAPSWSWASTNSQVDFATQVTGLTATIISCNVELANKGTLDVDTRFGAVKSGQLEIRGVLRRAEVVRNRKWKGWYLLKLQVPQVSHGGTGLSVRWYPDTLDDAEPKIDATGERTYSLVLKLDEATGHFTRCGLIGPQFEPTPEELSWIRGGEVQTIVII
ncbi:hypothetical protein EG327_002324 [Venturia inaequalis]|uniref:Heterokaryon incompatibility domain-containing protein n=1 Tax=Venturia inaequalis TaxID=5025 RepID=A0A8H3VIH3_VENIN|nr:hypothetical protein EG327_002324 [Venturia inaequalis]